MVDGRKGMAAEEERALDGGGLMIGEGGGWEKVDPEAKSAKERC